MITMILNNVTTKPIELSNYSRALDVPDQQIRFRMDIQFGNDCDISSFDRLADYANTEITSIVIKDQNDNVMLDEQRHAKLESLSENYNSVDRYGYGSITVYED